jgi:hypothetical protein
MLLEVRRDSGEMAAAPAQLHVGSQVLLQGLASQPELNGTRGTLLAYDEAVGRWQVKLPQKHDTTLPAAAAGGVGSHCLPRGKDVIIRVLEEKLIPLVTPWSCTDRICR